MALIYADRVKETSTTTGTGTYTLAGAVTGFEAFSAVGNANTCHYCATDGTNWEVGLGTYTASGTTLARTTILASSNSDAAVDWAAGTRELFVTLPASAIAALTNASSKENDFRLTLTTATPVTTADVTGATTIYCTPYCGNRISLYDGANWVTRTSAEFSLALGTLTANRPYDVFCYDNAGTPTLEFLVWTSDTARATALVYQDGVLVKSGATTRRYLGTFWTTSTTQTQDAMAGRHLWNYYNRVTKGMRVIEETDSWTYTTATIRQARATASNKLDFVIGVEEDSVQANVAVGTANGTATVGRTVGIGLDSTSAFAAGSVVQGTEGAASGRGGTSAYFNSTVSVGRHYLAWLEYSIAAGTTTWYGDNGGSIAYQSGIIGSLRC